MSTFSYRAVDGDANITDAKAYAAGSLGHLSHHDGILLSWWAKSAS